MEKYILVNCPEIEYFIEKSDLGKCYIAKPLFDESEMLNVYMIPESIYIKSLKGFENSFDSIIKDINNLGTYDTLTLPNKQTLQAVPDSDNSSDCAECFFKNTVCTSINCVGRHFRLI